MKIEGKFELHSTHLTGQYLALCWSLNIMPQKCLKFRISSIVFSFSFHILSITQCSDTHLPFLCLSLGRNSFPSHASHMTLFPDLNMQIASPALNVPSIWLNQVFMRNIKHKREKNFQNFQSQMPTCAASEVFLLNG